MLPGIGSNVPNWLNRPLTHITPLSLSDGATYERKLDWVYKYVTSTLVPQIEGVLDQWFVNYKSDWENLLGSVDFKISEWDKLFADFMADIVRQLEKLNDQSVANLIEDTNSLTRVALDKRIKSYLDGSVDPRLLAMEDKVNGFSSQLSIIRKTVDTAPGRGVYTKRVKAGTGTKEHFLTVISNGDKAGKYSVGKLITSATASPPRETIENFHAKHGGNVLINASGWWESNRLMGLQIKDGTLIQGWDSSGDLGSEAVVFMDTGELRVYDKSTTPTKILSDGGWNSFSWGAAAIKDGNTTDFLSKSRYSLLSARQVIGSTYDGDLVIATFPGVTNVSGATGADILASLSGINFKHLYILDGGGSAQTLIDGEFMVRSSDTAVRPIVDALQVFAPVSNEIPNRWHIITDRETGFDGGGVATMQTKDTVYVRVGTVLASKTGTLLKMCSLPDHITRPLYPATTLAYSGGSPSVGLNARVTTAGDIEVTIPEGSQGGISVWFSYPREQRFS